MHWALAGLTLFLVGYVSRRILRLDAPQTRSVGLVPLSPQREEVYQPVALEIETQTVILGISLNEALGERDAGNVDNAWRLVRLAVCQWDRLADILSILLNAIGENLPHTPSGVGVRNMAANRFRSRSMIEFVKMRELLDQVVFRSRMRYQTHLRVLRRALETLTADFRKTYRTAERLPVAAQDMWSNLDPDFHDFDLLTKETMLAFRAFLVALPERALPAFAGDLNAIVSHSVRSKSPAASHLAEG